MDPKEIQQLLVKTAEYIEKTQPLIDAQNESKVAFITKATKTAKMLGSLGLIDSNRVNEFVDKVAEDPSSVWDFIDKMATVVREVPAMGSVSDKVASAVKLDAFERLALFGSPHATGSQSGVVE